MTDVAVTEDGPSALQDVGWILWSGTVGFRAPLAGAVEAAALAGYRRMSISPLDVRLAAKEGVSSWELGRRVRAAGLEIVLDAVMNWYGGPRDDWPFGAHRSKEGWGITVEEVIRMSEELQAVSMNAVGQPTADVPIAELAEPFGRLCDLANDVGSQVTLEFMPMLAINDLAAAWSIVAGAARQNGGLMFDTWHFFRSGSDFATLERIPTGAVFMAQISDGGADDGPDLVEGTFNRRMPGDGSFDLLRALATLDRLQGLRWVGPEVISPITAAMAPAEAALTGRQRVAEIIQQACSTERALDG